MKSKARRFTYRFFALLIRHDNKCADVIAHPVKMYRTGFHDCFALREGQDASAATRIEPAIDCFGEELTVFALLALSVRLWIET